MDFPRGIDKLLKSAHQKILNLILNVKAKKSSSLKGVWTLVRLDRIFEELVQIRLRLDDIENMISSWHPQPIRISESKLLSLPDNLRKTYLVVASKGECNATQVSNLTARSRAIESSYLNQLVRMGWLAKRRNSKTLNFRALSSFIEKHELVSTSVPVPLQTRAIQVLTSRPIRTKETWSAMPSRLPRKLRFLFSYYWKNPKCARTTKPFTLKRMIDWKSKKARV